MKITHAYVAPAIGSTQSKVSMEAWEQSLERYNEGKHLEAFHLLLDPRRRFHIRQQRPVFRRRADIPQSVQRSDAESTDRRGCRAHRQHSHTFDKVKFHEIPPFSVCSQMPVLFLSIA